MFNKSGQKLMSLAKALCIIQIVLFSVLGAVLIILGIANEEPMQLLTGVLVLIVCIVSAWLSNLATYAFGELVVNTEQNTKNSYVISKNLKQINLTLNSIAQKTAGGEENKDWFCKECGTKNTHKAAFCKECGKAK